MNSEPLTRFRLTRTHLCARIDELKALKNGWLDGKGFAPAHDGLDWLAEEFDCYFPEDLLLPYLYPTAEAGIRLEWSIQPYEISLDIDLVKRLGLWHSLNLENDIDQFQEVNLNEVKSWEWLTSTLRQLVGMAA